MRIAKSRVEVSTKPTKQRSRWATEVMAHEPPGFEVKERFYEIGAPPGLAELELLSGRA